MSDSPFKEKPKVANTNGEVVYFSAETGSKTFTNERSLPWKSIQIINDGKNPITLLINGMEILIYSTDSGINENFEPFITFRVVASAAYRILLRY